MDAEAAPDPRLLAEIGDSDSSIRPARSRDLASIREIAHAYDSLAAWPGRPDHLDHEQKAGRMIVAVADDEIVGFASALERPPLVHLADLFVHPELLGVGIGGELLRALIPPGLPLVTFASADPRAFSLYLRHGLKPFGPLLHLEGRSAAIPDLRLSGVSAAVVAAERVAPLDLEASGRSRMVDLQFLGGSGGGRALLVTHEGRTAGYGFVRLVPSSESDTDVEAHVGPAGAGNAADLDRVTRALVGWAAERARTVHVSIFGAHPSLVALLGGGFRLGTADTLMASAHDLFAGDRYLPSPELG